MFEKVLRKLSDPRWLSSSKNTEALEVLMGTVETRTAVEQVGELPKAYLEIVEILLKHEFPPDNVPRFCRPSAVAFRAARMWAELPRTESAVISRLLKKTLMSSLLSLLQIDVSLLTIIVDDISQLIKNLMLVCELRADYTESSAPSIRAFRGLALQASSSGQEKWSMEIRLSTPAHLVRCQVATLGLLSQLLGVVDRGCLMRFLQESSSTFLWQTLCTLIIAPSATLPVRTSALKLVSSQLLGHVASPTCYRFAFSALLHVTQHQIFKVARLPATTASRPEDPVLEIEVHQCMRRLVSLLNEQSIQQCAPALFRVVESLHAQAHWSSLQGTLLMVLSACVAKVPQSGIRGCIAVAHLWGCPDLMSGVTGCHAAALAANDEGVAWSLVRCFEAAAPAKKKRPRNAANIVEERAALSSMLDTLWSGVRAAITEDGVQSSACICTALRLYALSCQIATPHRMPRLRQENGASVAGLLLSKFNDKALSELAKGVQVTTTEVSAIVDTAVLLALTVPRNEILSSKVRSAVLLAVEFLSRHVQAEKLTAGGALVNGSRHTENNAKDPAVVPLDGLHESLIATRLRVWNVSAQLLSRPLWERCLQLICMSADSITTAPGETRESVIRCFVDIASLAKASTQVKMIVQVPVLLKTLVLGDKSPASSTLLKRAQRFLLSVLHKSASEGEIGAEGREVCAAHSLGMIAREYLNPSTWAIQPGVCPRQVLLHQDCHPAPGLLIAGAKSGSGYMRVAWELFETLWREVTRSEKTLAEATRGELVRSCAAVLRFGSRSVLQERASSLTSLAEGHWQLLLQGHCSDIVRTVLANEASALSASGFKVLTLMENGALPSTTQLSPSGPAPEVTPDSSFTSAVIPRSGYLKTLEECVSKRRSPLFRRRREVIEVHVTSLGSLVRGIDFRNPLHEVSGRALLLWVTLRLVSVWSNRSVLNRSAAVEAYRQLDEMPNSCLLQLKRALIDEEPTMDKVLLLIGLLHRHWVGRFIATLLERGSSDQNAVTVFLKAVRNWLVPQLISGRETEALENFATLFVIDKTTDNDSDATTITHARRWSSTSDSSMDSSSNLRRGRASSGGDDSITSKAASSTADNMNRNTRGRKEVTSLLTTSAAFDCLVKMIHHGEGLMERIIIELLMVPLTPLVSTSATSDTSEGGRISSEELERRGEYLLQLLPREQSSFEDLIKGWDYFTLHWLVMWELSGSNPVQARRALRAVATLQGGLGVPIDSGGGNSGVGRDAGDAAAATPDKNNKKQGVKKQRGGRGAVASTESRTREAPPSAHRQQAYGDDAVSVACWVERTFLGSVWQVTFKFQDQPPAIQERRLLTLAEMLKCLSSARLARFVPKVMAILVPNLGDEAPPALTATSSRILVDFVRMLNDDTATEHLSAIVVPVLPLLERCGAATPTTHSPGDLANLKRAENSAVCLLRLLILERAEALQARFHCIPFLIRSNLAELKPVQRALAEAHGNPSLAEELEHLVALVKHDSMSIKRTTLRRLNEVLVYRRGDVLELVNKGNDDTAVTSLLKELFVICAQNTDPEAKLATAECLGSLGAIDPASLQLFAGNTGRSLNKAPETPPPPWTISKVDFSVLLVSDYLASALRESSSMEGQVNAATDRIACAIQNLFRIVKVELSLDKTAAMPTHLEEHFNATGNLELIRPLWASKYEITEVMDPRKPPFLMKGCSFTRWLAQLCRYLIKKSRGPFKDIFSAFSGVVKTCPNVAFFILPYLVLDSLSYGPEAVNEVIMDELLVALRGGEDPKEHGEPAQSLAVAPPSKIRIEPVVIQAVFTLVETFEHWMSTGATPPRKGKSRSAATAASPEVEISGWKMELEDIRRFLQGVPRAGMARAALNIRAYTRSLSYLEAIVQPQSVDAAARRGGSAQHPTLPLCTVTTKLPRASSADIDKLSKVYGSLDEPDGMVGLGALRHAIAEQAPTHTLQRIRAMEHAEQWTSVLQEYESALQDPASPAVARHGSRRSPNRGYRGDGDDGGDDDGCDLENGARDMYDDDHDDEDDDEFDNWDRDELDEGVLEHGMLRSLLVLGHLESVLNQYVGVSVSKPQLRSVLAPVAVAAAWRLQRWDVLSTVLSHWEDPTGAAAVEGKFEVGLAKTLSAMAMCRGSACSSTAVAKFDHAVREAREGVMEGLAAASRESYQRAYPLLFRLHLLSECEAGVKLVQASPSERESLLARQDWNGRMSLLSPSLPLRAPLIAVRKVIFTMANMPQMAVSDLLSYSKLARFGGNFDLAKSSWRQAKSLSFSADRLVIQEAKLLHAQGYTNRALQVIEPSENELALVRRRIEAESAVTSSRVGGIGAAASSGSGVRPRQQHSSGAVSDSILRQTGKRLLYATDWKVEAGRIHGDPVLEQYELARQARPQWARAYFSTAKYYDLLLTRRRETTVSLEKDVEVHELARQAVFFYTESLRFGSKFIFQAMPRLLTLFFEFSLLDDSSSGAASSSSNRSGRQSSSSSSSSGRSGNAKAAAAAAAAAVVGKQQSALAELQTDLNEIVRNAVETIPPHMWYTSIQQLISRVGHPDKAVASIVKGALIKIASEHSRETVWSVAPLFASYNDVRRKAGQLIMVKTAEALNIAGHQEESAAFANARHLFSDLIKNAQFHTNEKRTVFKMSKNMVLSDYVVPNCKTLTPTLQPKAPTAREAARHDPFPRSTMRIARFHEHMTVMHSKAKPKKVSLDTTTGETVSYLCKQEKNGDLRKDARLMEFNAVVNRMLQRDVAGRHRRLRLRTFAVICLNEECGLLEWVPNTAPMRSLIADAYAVHPAVPFPRFNAPSVRDAFCNLQKEHIPQQTLGEKFRTDVFEQFSPCFHRWFVSNFPEPTAWFEARTAFSRSVAVWSAVGHVVGLGDRHLENILIDTTAGECVHVDFDCLFDKGITLQRPEVVPFRLTSHMVEAFGVTGYEGIFRRVMEVTYTVLRENQETLVSVLEPFLQDPTLGWERQGRAQRKDDEDDRRAPSSHEAAFDPKRVLSTVRGRLRGVFNLRDSHAWRGPKPKPPAGISDSNLAFSVQGQVDRLIQEATSDENLSLMYVGWMPWL